MIKNVLLLSLVLLASCTCKKADNEYTYYVNSYTVDCSGVGPMKCMLIQKGDNVVDDQWQTFYSKIEGFDYEPGFLYKLLVKEEKLENVPADASSIKYTLVKLLEKKRDASFYVNGIWDAVKIHGSIIKVKRIRGGAVIPQIQIDIKNMRISGIDGCNNFTGTIKTVNDNNIELSQLAGTRKMCPDMATADIFNEAMTKVKTYKVTDNVLIFFDESGDEILEFSKVNPKMLLNNSWKVSFINGESVTGNTPQLELHTTEMLVHGNDGCNNINGKIIKLTDNELEFGALAGTRKVCPDMDIANRFNETIVNVKKYSITNHKLTLTNAGGKVLMVLEK